MANGDYIATEEIEQLTAYLDTTDDSELSHLLADQIRQYDTQNALKTLRSISASHHIKPEEHYQSP